MKRTEIVKGGRYAYSDYYSHHNTPYYEYANWHEVEVLDPAPAPTHREAMKIERGYRNVKPSGVLVKIKYDNGRFGEPTIVPLKSLRMPYAEYTEIRAGVAERQATRESIEKRNLRVGKQVLKALKKRFPDEDYYFADYKMEKGQVDIDLGTLAALLGIETGVSL